MDISAAITAEVRAQIASKGWSDDQAREAFGLPQPAFDAYFTGATQAGARAMGWDEFCSVAWALGRTPSELVELVEERAANGGP